MFTQLLAVMAPVLVSVAVGYFWVKGGASFPTDFVSRLCLNVGTPCLILSSLAETHISAEVFTKMALGSLGAMLVLAIIGLSYCRMRKVDWRGFVPALIFPNTGNIGLPISLFAFGKAGFGYAVSINVAVSIVQFGLSVMMDSKRPLLELARTPTIWSIVISVILMVFHLSLPQWVFNATQLLGGFTIPLMLITLGVALAQIRPNNLLGGMLFSLIRIAIVIPIALLAGYLVGLSNTLNVQLMLQMCMPVAVYTYMFALKANRTPDVAASRVFVSTVMSLIYLPIMLAIILHLGM